MPVGGRPKETDQWAVAAEQVEGGEVPVLEVRADPVVAIPPDGSPPTKRSGYTLTVLRKLGSRWLLSHDANLLSPEPPSGG